jgi:hypothetical protein
MLKLISVEALKVSLRQARGSAHSSGALNARAERRAGRGRLSGLVRGELWVKVILLLIIKHEGALQGRHVEAFT